MMPKTIEFSLRANYGRSFSKFNWSPLPNHEIGLATEGFDKLCSILPACIMKLFMPGIMQCALSWFFPGIL